MTNDSESISFVVPGVPQGKARARSTTITTKTGKSINSHYTPKKTRDYELSISVWAKDAMRGKSLLQGPVGLNLTIVMPIPKTWPKWKRLMAAKGEVLPTMKPDADNIEKAIKDGCNKILWVDDSYVVRCSKEKIFYRPGLEIGVHIQAYPISGHAAQIKKQSEVIPCLKTKLI